mgnify:FL=1
MKISKKELKQLIKEEMQKTSEAVIKTPDDFQRQQRDTANKSLPGVSISNLQTMDSLENALRIAATKTDFNTGDIARHLRDLFAALQKFISTDDEKPTEGN